MATDYTEDQLSHKLEYSAYLVNREILLSVAAMNGIKDVSEVMPKWMQPTKAPSGMTREGARAVLLAIEMRVIGGGALGQIGMPITEVEKLAG